MDDPGDGVPEALLETVLNPEPLNIENFGSGTNPSIMLSKFGLKPRAKLSAERLESAYDVIHLLILRGP